MSNSFREDVHARAVQPNADDVCDIDRSDAEHSRGVRLDGRPSELGLSAYGYVPYVPSSSGLPRQFTVDDIMTLNRSFDSADISARIAPTQLPNLNAKLNEKLRHRTADDVVFTTGDFETLPSSAFIAHSKGGVWTREAVGAFNTFTQASVLKTVGYSQTTTSPQPSITPPPRPAPRKSSFIEKVISGFLEDLERNPKGVLLPFIIGSIYFIVTCLGIFAGSIYETLDASKSIRTLTARQVFRYAFRSSGWQGIIASPFIFFIVPASVPTNTLTAGMSLFAFQNGFFWRGTMKRISDTFGESGAPISVIPSAPPPRPKKRRR